MLVSHTLSFLLGSCCLESKADYPPSVVKSFEHNVCQETSFTDFTSFVSEIADMSMSKASSGHASSSGLLKHMSSNFAENGDEA